MEVLVKQMDELADELIEIVGIDSDPSATKFKCGVIACS
jgi:hypothetical protein